MVSFKRLAVFATAIAAAASAVIQPQASQDLEARADRRHNMQIMHSRQGRFVFLLGSQFPTTLTDMFYSMGEGGPAKELLKQFTDWLSEGKQRAIYEAAYRAVQSAVKIGGIYGKGGEVAEGNYGFGFQTTANPSFNVLGNLEDALLAWAQSEGDQCEVLARPNDFIDLARIGAGNTKRAELEGRSRETQCPNVKDKMIKYAKKGVPEDANWGRDYRWVEKC